MIRLVGIVSALIFALDAIPAARAQVMLDVAKITCEQFAGYQTLVMTAVETVLGVDK